MSKNNSPNIEQKIATLEKTVAWFDGEEFELEAALAQYESAQKLAEEIQRDLETLKNSVVRVDTDAA